MSQAAGAESSKYSIRAVERVCDILETLALTSEPVALPELARASGLPKSSTFRYLNTLEERRFVERDEVNATYRLGSALIALQPNRVDRLVAAAKPILRELRDEFGETTNLGIRDGAHIVYLDIVESSSTVRLVAHPGARDDLHCTALGKAIAASYSDAMILDLIGSRYDKRTENSHKSWIELAKDLGNVRARGYAVDDEENEIGGRCVGAHIDKSDAAISVSGPSSRMPMARVHAIGEVLASRVAEIKF